MRSEGAFYSLVHGQGLVVLDAPPHLAQLMTPEALVALSLRSSSAKQQQQQQQQQGRKDDSKPSVSSQEAAGAAVAAGGDAQGRKPAPAAAAPMAAAGSMRLTLTEEVRVKGGQSAPVAAGDGRALARPTQACVGVGVACVQERRARDEVVLPYEHRGTSAPYQTRDWRTYLPAAAGGTSGAATHAPHVVVPPPAPSSPSPGLEQQQQQQPQHAAGQLGEIHYMRDSDEENGGLHDSDEDPDDDLDI